MTTIFRLPLPGRGLLLGVEVNRTRTKNANLLEAGVCVSVAKRDLFLLVFLAVAAIEFINAAGGVDELHLTSVERVRCVRNLDLYYRVLNTFDSDGLLGVGTRTCNEHVVV